MKTDNSCSLLHFFFFYYCLKPKKWINFGKFSGKFGMRVKRCFSFSDTNNTVALLDQRGWGAPFKVENHKIHFSSFIIAFSGVQFAGSCQNSAMTMSKELLRPHCTPCSSFQRVTEFISSVTYSYVQVKSFLIRLIIEQSRKCSNKWSTLPHYCWCHKTKLLRAHGRSLSLKF